jgi:hypothetical protein
MRAALFCLHSKNSVTSGELISEFGLAHSFLFQSDGARAARWALHAISELAHIDLQLADGAAEGIAVHAKLACCPALIAFVFLEDGQNKALFEFTHTL